MLKKSLADSFETTVSALSDYNAALEKEGAPGNVNEAFLECKVSELEQMEFLCSESGELYWLTYARLFELALLCAGNYADSFEFAAAGDLLANPRLILIRFRSGCTAVKKDRRRKLTDQFAYVASERETVVTWLKEETLPEIIEKPLLTHMQERMVHSGLLSKGYIELVERRLKQMADAIGFLASWHLTGSRAFHLMVQSATSSERSFIESNLCRFDKEIFVELGKDFHNLAADPYQASRFLNYST